MADSYVPRWTRPKLPVPRVRWITKSESIWVGMEEKLRVELGEETSHSSLKDVRAVVIEGANDGEEGLD